jgi:hypothetical protein
MISLLKINIDRLIDEIIPNKLFLGNLDASLDKEMLMTKKITHILIAASDLEAYH